MEIAVQLFYCSNMKACVLAANRNFDCTDFTLDWQKYVDANLRFCVKLGQTFIATSTFI